MPGYLRTTLVASLTLSALVVAGCGPTAQESYDTALSILEKEKSALNELVAHRSQLLSEAAAKGDQLRGIAMQISNPQLREQAVAEVREGTELVAKKLEGDLADIDEKIELQEERVRRAEKAVETAEASLPK